MAFMKKLDKIDDKKIQKFIDKADKEPVEKKQEWKNILLRIRQDLLKDIDIQVENRIGMNRTAWILEAVQEKINKK